MKKKHIVGFLGTALFSVGLFHSEAANAAPALIQEQTYQQPDGTTFTATLYGDEHFNYTAGTDGSVYEKRTDGFWYYKSNSTARTSSSKVGIDAKPSHRIQKEDWIAQNESQQKQADFNQEVLQKNALGLNQEQNLLVLLVEFDDVKLSFPESEWSEKIFSTEGDTVRNFYLEQTNNRIDIVPAKDTAAVKDGVIKVSLNQDHPDTTGEGIGVNSQAFGEQVLKQVEDQVDFTIYDTNKDGQISPNELHIMFIAAGYERTHNGGYDQKAVWGHKTWFNKYKLPIIDGLAFTDLTIFGEKMKDEKGWKDITSTIGIITHEFGHDLGLPDLYNIDSGNVGSGLGPMSAMAAGAWGADKEFRFNLFWEIKQSGSKPAGLDAYSKMLLGVPVEELDMSIDNEKAVLSGANDMDPTILKIPTDNPKEYFLIENRQMEGFNRGMFSSTLDMPGGIAAYRINTDYQHNYRNGRQLVTALEADEGILGYSNYFRGITKDSNPFYYVGNSLSNEPQPTTINKSTAPSTVLSDGTYSDFNMTVLDSEAASMKVAITKQRPLENISFDFAKQTVEIGQTLTPALTFAPANATNKSVRWASSDTTIATVDENGKVSGLKAGTTTITAVSEEGEKSASFELEVTKRIVPLEDLVVETEEITLLPGQSYKVNVGYVPAEAEETTQLRWSTNYPTLLGVSQEGVLTAKMISGTKIEVYVKTTDGTITKKLIVKIASVIPGASKEEAVEIDPIESFGKIYFDQNGWIKFKSSEAGNYTIPVFGNDRSAVGITSQVSFYNEETTKMLGYEKRIATGPNSSTVYSKMPVYYDKDEYVYIHFSCSKPGGLMYVDIKKTVTGS